MIRKIITLSQNNLTISLPDDFLGKQIEVIAFIVEDQVDGPQSFDGKKTFSTFQIDTQGFKFNREEANER